MPSPASEPDIYAPPRTPVEIEQVRSKTPSFSWWGLRRWRLYNAVVIASGFAATCVAAIHDIREGLDARGIVTGFEVAAISGVVYVILANICYLAGPVLDHFVPPALEESYRKTAYGLGLVLAVGIPSVLTIAYVMRIGGPD